MLLALKLGWTALATIVYLVVAVTDHEAATVLVPAYFAAVMAPVVVCPLLARRRSLHRRAVRG